VWKGEGSEVVDDSECYERQAEAETTDENGSESKERTPSGIIEIIEGKRNDLRHCGGFLKEGGSNRNDR
jgi:hypothetical protein